MVRIRSGSICTHLRALTVSDLYETNFGRAYSKFPSGLASFLSSARSLETTRLAEGHHIARSKCSGVVKHLAIYAQHENLSA